MPHVPALNAVCASWREAPIVCAGSGGSEADVSGSSSDGGGSAVGAALPQLVDQMHLGGGGGAGAAAESARSPTAPILISPRRGSMLSKAAAASAASKMAVDSSPGGGGGAGRAKGVGRLLGASSGESPPPPSTSAAQGGGLEPHRTRQSSRSREAPVLMHPARRNSSGEATAMAFRDIAEPSTPSRDNSEARSPVKEGGAAGAGRGFSAAELRAYERTNLLLRELHFERLGRLSIRDDDESSPPEKGRGPH